MGASEYDDKPRREQRRTNPVDHEIMDTQSRHEHPVHRRSDDTEESPVSHLGQADENVHASRFSGEEPEELRDRRSKRAVEGVTRDTARVIPGDARFDDTETRPADTYRGDEVVRDEIRQLLDDHPNLDAERVDVEVKDGEVILTGATDTEMDARYVAELCRGVRGVHRIQSALEVSAP